MESRQKGLPGTSCAWEAARSDLVQQALHQVQPGHDVGEEPGAEGPAQGFGAGIGGADADDVGAAPQRTDGDLDGEVLVGLDHGALLVEVVDQHPPAGPLPLEQAAVADQGGEVWAGGIVSDVHQGGVQGFPLLADLTVDLGGAQQLLFLQALRQGGEVEKMGNRPQLLGHEPDVFVGLVIAGGNAGVAHQGADVGDGAVGPGVLL